MIEWFLKNKDWIFSGVGIALILLIFDFLKNLRNKRNEQIKQISERYIDILDGKNRGHSGVPGLIESGAAKLAKNKYILDVCAKIEESGKPNPLNIWILKYIDKKEILKFVKWQSEKKISYSPHYFNENNFARLVEKYKAEKG